MTQLSVINAHAKIFEMSEKKTREKLLYQDVMKYIVERSYRAEAEKHWKRTIRRKAGDFVVKVAQEKTADVGYLMKKTKKE